MLEYINLKDKPLITKTKNLPSIIAIITLVILAIMILSILSGRDVPPVLRFLDERTNTSLSGFVYLDEQYIGRVYGDGFFNDMPKEYCKGKHTISLKSSEYALNWETMPSDCRAGLVTLRYGDGEMQ